MRRKIVALWISLVIMVSSIVILVEIAERVEAPTTLYVGSGGGGNYSKIQWAIDNASDGDTVYVYNGTYYEYLVINKTISLIGDDKETTIIYVNGTGDVVFIDKDWINITNFTITRNSTFIVGDGIDINIHQNCRIENTIISNNRYGIWIDGGHNNTFIGNIYINNSFGIWVRFSADSIISNSTSFNNMIAIYLVASTNITLVNNTMNNDGVEISSSQFEHWVNHNIDITNTVNGKPVYYWKNQNIGTIPQDAGQVLLANCSNIKIENQNVSVTSTSILVGFSSNIYIANNTFCSNKYRGIELYKSNMNRITNNNCSLNGRGISVVFSNDNNINNNTFSTNLYTGVRLWSSDYNIISNNNILFNNQYGISIEDASNDNLIYHNNLINNSVQAFDEAFNNLWNDKYPSGGNYWSDYTGVDLNRTPFQDIPPPDGFGDIPYEIDSNSQDEYPLMEPINNYIILSHGWNLISIPLIQANQNLTKVLEMINGYYNAAQWYDITDQSNPWKHHKVGKPFGNDLFYLNETMSFWIHITNSEITIFLYNGTPPTSNQTIQLYKGWNMVGYPCLTSHNRTAGLNNLTFDTHVDAIQWYDAATQTWHFMDQNDSFVPGRGYWVHSKVEAGWEVPL